MSDERCKWTRGPWRLVGPFKGTVRAGAEWIGKIHWKNREANARLIAAAPDLYATLEWLARSYSSVDDDVIDERVSSVLARARGEP